MTSGTDTLTGNREEAIKALDILLKDLGRACLARLMLMGDIETTAELLPTPTMNQKQWFIRQGTVGGAIAQLLIDAAENGLSEDEIVLGLAHRGIPTSAKDPRRAVHWALYNIKRRSGAIERGADKRWRVTGTIPSERNHLERIIHMS